MAGIPYVQDPAQMLWQFQQDAARTNLLNSQTRLTDANAQEQQIKNLLTGQNIQANNVIQRVANEQAQEDAQAATKAPVLRDDAFQGPMPNGEAVTPPRQQRAELSPIEQAQQDIESRTKTAMQYEQIVNRARAAGVGPEYLDKYIKTAQEIRNKVADDRIKLMTEQGKQLEQIGGIAGGVADARTPEALALAIRQISAIDPRILGRLPVEFDPATGKVVPSDQTYTAFANLGAMSMDRAKQLKAQNDVATLKQTQWRDRETAQYHTDELERRRQEDVARDVRAAADREAANARTAATQAGANARQKSRLDFAGEALGLREQKEQTRVEQQGNAAVQKDPTVSSLDKYEKAFNAAKNVVENINNETWLKSRNVSEPAADAMMQEYRNAVQNFRANSGGKWSVEDQKKYASTLEKLNSFVQTIGQGKKPGTRVMQDVAGEINRMYQEQNAAALKATLRQREIVYNQGGDPNNVQSRASVDRAIASGKAKSWTDPDTGVQYLRFGPGKDDAFPIYTAPKVKRPRAGAAALTNLVGGEEMVAE